MLQNRTAVVALATVVVTLGACSRKPEPQPPTPTTGQTTTPTTTQRDTAAERRAREEEARRAEADRLAREQRDRESALSGVRNTIQEMVFFDYDQASIRDDARSVLDRKIPLLRANPNVTLRIEGHADERGSVEYNLTLSLRRANAIRDYLAGFGLEGNRFEVVPIGEERPLDGGQTEDAFARNRRGEFHIMRGGENLVSPR